MGTLRRECLDHVLVYGEQAIDVTARINRRQAVQGLISEYRRAA